MNRTERRCERNVNKASFRPRSHGGRAAERVFPYRRCMQVDLLQRVCGSLEVARDLVGRSGTMYVMAMDDPDSSLVERFTEAARALALVAEALEGQVHSS